MNLLNNHNFKIVGGDTDSIMFCKGDESLFSKEEQIQLLNEINNLLPELINFDNDGVFPKVIYLKAKNYILFDGVKIKLKGSSLKSSTLEPKMKEMLWDFINALVFDKQDTLLSIYEKYVKEASDIKDMKPWGKKCTLSATTYKSERANETRIIDAIKGSEYVEGDKVYLYRKEKEVLELVDKFDGIYHKDTYYEKIYKMTDRFSEIMDISIFLNYKLKRNKKLLDNLLGISYNKEIISNDIAKESE